MAGLDSSAGDLVDLAGRAGLHPLVTSARRTRSQQRRLYHRYLAGLNPFPVAPPGTSKHEYGLAFDLLVTPYDALEELGRIWEQAGGRWGGRGDPVHFEI